jgi:hypothetical protein
MTKLKFINFYIVQWFFFRICRFIEDDFTKDNFNKQTYYGILFPILPLTGWWMNIKFISNNFKPRNYYKWKIMIL